MVRSVVVLPAPLVPMGQTTSPSPTVKLIPLTAGSSVGDLEVLDLQQRAHACSSFDRLTAGRSAVGGGRKGRPVRCRYTPR